MSRTTDFNPNWASAPGDTIAEILKAKQLSLATFAEEMNSTPDYIRQLLHGYISINDEIAEKLSKNLGASPAFWIKRETVYRESIERLRSIEEEKWLTELPVKDMSKFGWIEKKGKDIAVFLDYFNVPDVWTWRRKYSDLISLTAFRKSTSFNSQPGSVAAWLRQGEIQAQTITCKPWNKKKFTETLKDIRKLTKKKSPSEFLPNLRELCAECGVAIAIVPNVAGCAVSGASQFITEHLAIITLSFRYKTDDQFWFTFFHEAGHLILHSDQVLFIEYQSNDYLNDQKEIEANNFAMEVLIPKEMQSRLRTMAITKDSIIRFSKDADISLGILVGQLQHLNRVEFKNLNGYKRKYKWEEIF